MWRGGDPSRPSESHPATLAGTTWTVVAINGVPVQLRPQPALGFDADRVKGSGGCNTFGGGYQYDPATGEVGFTELGMTAMACAEPIRNQVEAAFTAVIGQASLVATLGQDGHLVIAGPAGRLDLVAGGPALID